MTIQTFTSAPMPSSGTGERVEMVQEPPKVLQGSEFIWKEGVPIPRVYFMPTLVDMLVPIMATHYPQFPRLDDVPRASRDRIVSQLALDLPLALVAHRIHEEFYWKKRASLIWCNCDIAAHGNSWKQLFFERNLSDFLERSCSFHAFYFCPVCLYYLYVPHW